MDILYGFMDLNVVCKSQVNPGHNVLITTGGSNNSGVLCQELALDRRADLCLQGGGMGSHAARVRTRGPLLWLCLGLARASPSPGNPNCPMQLSVHGALLIIPYGASWGSSCLQSCFNQILHVQVPAPMVVDGEVGIGAGYPCAGGGGFG